MTKILPDKYPSFERYGLWNITFLTVYYLSGFSEDEP